MTCLTWKGVRDRGGGVCVCVWESMGAGVCLIGRTLKEMCRLLMKNKGGNKWLVRRAWERHDTSVWEGQIKVCVCVSVREGREMEVMPVYSISWLQRGKGVGRFPQ